LQAEKLLAAMLLILLQKPYRCIVTDLLLKHEHPSIKLALIKQTVLLKKPIKRSVFI